MKSYIAFAITVLSLLSLHLNAQTYTWNGGAADNDWENPANWTPSGPPSYPGPGETAIIAVAANYPIIGFFQFEQCSKLVIHSGATVTIEDINGSLELYEGDSLINAGDIIIKDNGHLDINDVSGTKVNFINSGSITIQDDGDLSFSDVNNEDGAFLNSGTITLQGNGRVDVTKADTLLNSGDIIIHDNGVFYAQDIIYRLFNSANIVLSENGTFRIMATSTTFFNSGSITISGNGAWQQEFGSDYGNLGGSFTLSRAGINDPMKFNFWSSPIASQNVSALGTAYYFDPSQSTHDLTDDETDPGWISAGGNMAVGAGYAGAGSGTVNFSGVPNNGDLLVPVQYNDSLLFGSLGPGVPYNLIGNPYPSPLNIQEFFNVNGSEIYTGAVYVWDSQTSGTFQYTDYATVAPFGSIDNDPWAVGGPPGTYSSPPYYTSLAPGQGFFIDVDAATSGFIMFTNGMRTEGASDDVVFFKQADMQRLWLNVMDADSTVYNELLVIFSDDATTGFDKMFDAKKLKGNTKLSLYSVNNDKEYAIQGLPYLMEQETEVPVGVSMDQDITVTFSLKWEESLEGFDIYLKDTQTGTFTDLRNASYSLQIPGGTHNGRFSIVMMPKTVTGMSQLPDHGLSITHNDGALRIGNRGNELQTLERITLFDLSGKRLKAWNAVTLEVNGTISLPFEPGNSGYYVVDVVTAEKTIQQKVRIIN